MPELLNALQEEIAAALEHLDDPQPPFEFRIGWSRDYNALFRQEVALETGIEGIVQRALANGRVLLHARGGSGKTVVLVRLLKESLGKNRAAIYVDLRLWTPADYESWRATPGEERLAFVLERFGVPRIGQVALDALPPEVQRLLLVDGLNEIVTSTAQEILETLADFARRAPSSGIVLTDRLVRRELPQSPAWQLGTILPLTPDEVRAHLRQGHAQAVAEGAPIGLLDSPYFLDAALKGDRADSSVEVHERYFRQHVGLTAGELQASAAAAFEMYERSRARTFLLEAFQHYAGQAVVVKLQQAGALLQSGEQAYFSHHLKHDYLAARYLAQDQTRWTDETLNTVTFRAASFDCLEMTLQLLPTSHDGDVFIRSVYDWNQYAAGYAVAEGRRRGRVPVSPEMEVALLAMLAERRWDLISATAERVTDALQLFRTPVAEQFLQAGSLEDVRRIVRQKQFGNAFAKWADLFCRSQGDHVSDEELELLLGHDSLLAWTLSNVLKRLRVSETQQTRLRSMLPAASRAARWRIVHTLGAFPSKANARALIDVLDRDEYPWARYGAIRSLVEMAASGDPKLREQILSALTKRGASIALEERVLQELERAIFVDPARAPRDWGSFAVRVFKALHDSSSSIEARDHWERLAYRARERYSAQDARL